MKGLKSYVIITIGSILYALSFDWFLAPNHFAVGGVTGLAQILHHLYPPLTIGVTTLLLNIPLFLAGWWKIGWKLLLGSLFSMAVSSLAIDALNLRFDFQPMNPILACVYGGLLMGIGSGLIFSQGATTGGSDIVAKLLKLKYPWLPMGRLVMIPDMVVMILVTLVFGAMEPLLYGLINLYIYSKAMDTVLYGAMDARVAYIVSDLWRDISEALLREQGRGVTILQGQGAYTGQEKQVLMIAFRQREIVEIKQRIFQLDPHAFLIVCDARDILGDGFAAYRKEE